MTRRRAPPAPRPPAANSRRRTRPDSIPSSRPSTSDRLPHEVGVVGERDPELCIPLNRNLPPGPRKRAPLRSPSTPERHPRRFAQCSSNRQTQAVVTSQEAFAPSGAAEVEGARVRSVRASFPCSIRGAAAFFLAPVAVSSLLLGATSDHLARPSWSRRVTRPSVAVPEFSSVSSVARRPASRLGPFARRAWVHVLADLVAGVGRAGHLQPRRPRHRPADRDQPLPLPRLLHRPPANR